MYPIKKFFTFNLSNVYSNRYKLAFISFTFRLLFVVPMLVFIYSLELEYLIYIIYPISTCLLCIIINNLNLLLLSYRAYITVFLSSLFFTIIIKNLVISSVYSIILFIGFEYIICLLVDFVCVDVIMALTPLSGVPDPNNVGTVAYNPQGQNQPFGRNLVVALSNYGMCRLSKKLINQYEPFILGAIQHSTTPDGIELNNKLLANWDPNSGKPVPWRLFCNSGKLHRVLLDA